MLKRILFAVSLPLMLAACSSDEPKPAPEPEVLMQVESLTNVSATDCQQFSYDSNGRVTSYKKFFTGGSAVIVLEYISDNLVQITTRQEWYRSTGERSMLRIYKDELHVENGLAISCDGTFFLQEEDRAPFEKKYRHEFFYTADNHLENIKWTEWNKVGDKWAEDKPWSWDIFYYWENGNLVKVEDYLGHSYPYATYTLNYNNVSGVKNIVPVPMGIAASYPLQLTGFFGKMPVNLINEIIKDQQYDNYSIGFQYEITDNRIAQYSELQEDKIKDTFSVEWSK